MDITFDDLAAAYLDDAHRRGATSGEHSFERQRFTHVGLGGHPRWMESPLIRSPWHVMLVWSFETEPVPCARKVLGEMIIHHPLFALFFVKPDIPLDLLGEVNELMEGEDWRLRS